MSNLTTVQKEQIVKVHTAIANKPSFRSTVNAWSEASVINGMPVKQRFMSKNGATCPVTNQNISGDKYADNPYVSPLEARKTLQELVLQVAESIMSGEDKIDPKNFQKLQKIHNGQISVQSKNHSRPSGVAGYYPVSVSDGNVAPIANSSPLSEEGIDAVMTYNKFIGETLETLKKDSGGDLENTFTQEDIDTFIDEVIEEFKLEMEIESEEVGTKQKQEA